MQIVSIAWNVKSYFLGNKTNNDFFWFFLSSTELAQIVVIRYPRAPIVVSLSKTLYRHILVLVSTQEDAA